MLDPDEAATVAEQFGVSDEQVRRDHLISHLLAVLGDRLADRVVFFGGTALARTHLPDGRLSEDLDLFAVQRRVDVAATIEQSLAVGVRRAYGNLTWDPPLTAVSGATPAVLRTPDGLVVRVQLLDRTGYPPWPTETRELIQRFSDPPPARLLVPTRAAFVASKTSAWHDRRAPRDLYDLWGLARLGAMDAEAASLFARLGPTGRPPSGWLFDRPPGVEDWQTQLAGQTRIAVSPVAALQVVRKAWMHGTGAPECDDRPVQPSP
jgi:hypothetical protein